MREIESDGETANGQAGAQSSTTGAPWKVGPLGARDGGERTTGLRGHVECGCVTGACLREAQGFSFRGFRNLVGSHPQKKKTSLQREEKKGKRGKGMKEKKNARLEWVFSHHLERATWNGWSRFLQWPPLRKSGKIRAVSRKARRSRGRGGACALTPRLPVAKARRTVLRRAGKGSLAVGSLNPHPISQVPRVKPAKGPWLNHRAATPPAPSANPWGPAAFFFFFLVTRQEEEACSGSSCHLLTSSGLL